MSRGYFALVLHAHLPFVRHPEHAYFLEENWLFEAITDTYIPLIHAFQNLEHDGVDFRLTLSLSPTLVTMLGDPMLKERYAAHLDRLVELAEREMERTSGDDQFHYLAEFYLNRFLKTRETWRACCGDLAGVLWGFARSGKIEIISCTATHMFLPNGDNNTNACRAQIQAAKQNHRKYFGADPNGMWLGECAYMRGLDDLLAENGIRYFFVDSHALMHADQKPVYGVYAPIYCPSGVAAFARDIETSRQVWSANEGYPGDYAYRDFYRDVGFDLDRDYVGPYIHPDGIRLHTGIKYYSITHEKMDGKEPYNPALAAERVAEHAGNFIINRIAQADYLSSIMDRTPLVVSPYDAELFGHWWFEGPAFLEMVFRKMQYDQNTIVPITASEYLCEYPTNQVTTPSMSSWGYKGYGEFWLNNRTHWIYRHLHKMSEQMAELANTHPNAQGLMQRMLNQAARELLLAQSSDWAFIMSSGTAEGYAMKRNQDHIQRFWHLNDAIHSGSVNEAWFERTEEKNNIFPDLDYRIYAGHTVVC